MLIRASYTDGTANSSICVKVTMVTSKRDTLKQFNAFFSVSLAIIADKHFFFFKS